MHSDSSCCLNTSGSLISAFALKTTWFSPPASFFHLLGKSGKFWDLCLGKQGAWLVLQPLSFGLEVVHPSLLLVRPFPGTLHLLGAEESLISQERIIRSGPNLDDTLRTSARAVSRSCTRNGRVLTKLQAFLSCLALSYSSCLNLRSFRLPCSHFEADWAVTSGTSSLPCNSTFHQATS